MDTKALIREFILTNFITDNLDFAIEDETQLLESGVIDSTGVMELVLYLESELGIAVPPEDLLPENFSTIAAVARYADRRGLAAGKD